jgi:hypothetical protein
MKIGLLVTTANDRATSSTRPEAGRTRPPLGLKDSRVG